MKTKMLILAFLSLMFVLKSNAQPWIYTTVTGTGGNGTLETNVTGSNIFFGNNADQMTLTGGGDLNITGGLNGYMIGSDYILWNYGDVTSIFVGDFAGNNTSTSPNANTFWGYGTGNSTFTGSYNSFGGYLSGVSNVYGDSNVFIGNQCGYNNSSGSVNVYIGNLAGYNSNADSNVFIGDQSGYWNSTGYENTLSPDKI